MSASVKLLPPAGIQVPEIRADVPNDFELFLLCMVGLSAGCLPRESGVKSFRLRFLLKTKATPARRNLVATDGNRAVVLAEPFVSRLLS